MNTKVRFTTLLTCTLLSLAAARPEVDGIPLATQIKSMRVFPSPIEWIGDQEPPQGESAELLPAMEVFHARGVKAGMMALEHFVAAYPDSAWTPSVRMHLAEEYRSRGRYSLALVHWDATWKALRASKITRGQDLAVGALSGQAYLLASLAQRAELEDVLRELDASPLPLHVHSLAVAAARAHLATMKARPGDSYRCGVLALRAFAGAVGQDAELKRRVLQPVSPEGGFTLAQLVDLAATNGIEVIGVRRPEGAPLVVPCVVHWRLNHYAAVLEKQGDRYCVSDPSFGERLWMDRDVVEAEASGAFLLLRSQAPANWQRLTLPEASSIQGSGYPNTIPDEDDRPPEGCGGGEDEDADCDPPSANDGAGGGPPPPPPACCGGSGSGGGEDSAEDDNIYQAQGPASSLQFDTIFQPAVMPATGYEWYALGAQMPGGSGMPQWRVSQPYITLWLHDTPLRYGLSNGKWMELRLTYKHRGQDLGNQSGGFGPKWHCNWLAMLGSKPQGQTPDLITNYLAGGGIQCFQTNGAVDYRTARAVGGADPLGGMALGPIPAQPRDPPTPDTSGGFRFPVGQFRLIGAIPPAESYVPIIVHPPIPASPPGSVFTPARSQNRYEFAVGYANGTTNYYLTHRLDRYGRTVLFNYETNATLVRLESVVDLDGRTNRLYYTNASFPHLITSVVSPYGQTSSFTYDERGRLTNIVDAAALASSFQYDSNDNITNMITVYGQTAFQLVEGTSGTPYYSQNRALLITEPNGQHQAYAYCDNGPEGVSGGGDNYPLYRNSYHWDRAQYAAISEQGKTNLVNMPDADYLLAQTKHWLHGGTPSTNLIVSDTLNAMAGPVDPLTGERAGKMVFIYQGQAWPHYVGSLKRISEIYGPDGHLMIDITRNDVGRPLVLTYYNEEGISPAVYSNTHDATGEFLQTQTGPRGELVRGYGYHPVLTNLLTSVTNALGEVIRYTHDTNTLKVTSITFPSGLVRTNIYYTDGPSQGFLWKEIDVGLRTNSFGYQNGHVAARTNELGLVTTYLWDSLGRLVCTSFPDGTTVSNLYNRLDLAGRKDRLDHWTWYGYDSVRQLTAVTNANNQVTQYEYCGCGSPSRVTRWDGARAVVTEFTYDIVGRLVNTVHADSYQVARTYDTRNLLTDITDSGGRHVQVLYRPVGLGYDIATVYMVWDQSSITLLSKTHDEYGHVVQSMDGNGVVVTNGYDFLGRLTGRQVFSQMGLQYGIPETGPEYFVYNSRGLTNYFDPLGRLTTFVRDVASRVLFQTNANTEVLAFTYNPKDQLLTLTDGKNQTTAWHYDQYGRVTNKVDAADTEIFRYQYDPAGRLTNRWTVAKGDTGYGYDALGNLLSISYPQVTISYGYDSLNRLTNMTDARGTTAFTWTDGNQLAGEDGPWSADTVTYTYNNRLRASLNVAQPNASPWSQTYAYDSCGRLDGIVSPAGAFGYQYAGFDLVEDLPLPTGGRIHNDYDGVARLLSTTLQDAGQATINNHEYSYDLNSQRTQQVFTAGNYVDYTYDDIGQLKTARGTDHLYDYQTGQYVDTPRLQEQFGYAYDKAWNLNYRTNNQLVQTFGVNNLNELTTAGRSGTLTVAGTATERRANYPWDSGVTSVTVSGTGLSSGAAELYTDGTWARAGATLADGQNTYTASAEDAYGRTSQDSVTVNLPASTGFSYDGNGNLLSDDRRYFEYDWENQLTNVCVSGHWRSEFAYDGLGRRRIRREYRWQSGIGTWQLTNEVHYVYDGRLVVQERNANNLAEVSYTRGRDLGSGLESAGGIGGLLARTDHRLFAIADANAHAYYHADGNGNITCLINTNSAVVGRYGYDPYGNILAASGPLAGANLHRFSSKEHHPNSGTLYYLYRYYDPNLQRWLIRDPQGEPGFESARRTASAREGECRNEFDFALGRSRLATNQRSHTRTSNPFPFVGNGPMSNVDPFGLDYWNCLANCIEQNDPLNLLAKGLLTGLGGPVPKSLYKAFGGRATRFGGGSRFTTLPSIGAAQERLGPGNWVRRAGRVSFWAWVIYGDYMFGVEVACASYCAGDPTAYQ